MRAMIQDSTDLSFDEEITDRMAFGSPRDALRLLMRAVPEKGRRLAGEPEGASDHGAYHFRLAACFAMLGMEPDALDWCSEGEKHGRLRQDVLLGFQLRTLRFWLMVEGRRLASVIESATSLLRSPRIPDDVRAAVVAGLIQTAARSGDYVTAHRFREASSALQNRHSLGSALLDLVIADMLFREALLELPQFEDSLARRAHPTRNDLHSRPCLADRILRIADRFRAIAEASRNWPLLADMADLGEAAARLLCDQLCGHRPSLVVLERHAAALSSRGLTPLVRVARYFLGVLTLHQGRCSTAEAWLTSGVPLKRPADGMDPDEVLLLAYGREERHDVAGAFRFYRAYVRAATEQAAHRCALRDLPIDRAAGDTPEPARRAANAADLRAHRQPAIDPVSALHGTPPHAMTSGGVHQVAGLLARTASAVREMVENDLSRPLLVRDIVAALGISRRTLEIRVRRASGTSVKRFVTSIRLQHAHDMVLSDGAFTTEQFKKIALHTGFPTYRTFTAAYRQQFGTAPRRRLRTSEHPLPS